MAISIIHIGLIIVLIWVFVLGSRYSLRSVHGQGGGGRLILTLLAIIGSVFFIVNKLDNGAYQSNSVVSEQGGNLLHLMSTQPQVEQSVFKWPKIYIGLQKPKEQNESLPIERDGLVPVVHRENTIERGDQTYISRSDIEKLRQELLNTVQGSVGPSLAPNPTNLYSLASLRQTREVQEVRDNSTKLSVQSPSETWKDLNHYSIQVAAGSKPNYVWEEARNYQRDFPNQEVYIYQDPDSEWLKILVGRFDTKIASENYKNKIERLLRKKFRIISDHQIDQQYLTPLQ